MWKWERIAEKDIKDLKATVVFIPTENEQIKHKMVSLCFDPDVGEDVIRRSETQ